MDLKSIDAVYLALAFLVPGQIILFFRSRFTTGRMLPFKEAVLPYLAISLTYYALALPLVDVVLHFEEPGYAKSLAWFGLVFVGPTVAGVGWGIIHQVGLGRRLLAKVGLHVVHPVPSAWDFKFGDMPAQWVLVTLKNGTRFAGYYGKKALASSDPVERDIYIAQVYDLDEQHNWTARADGSSVLGPVYKVARRRHLRMVAR